MLKKIGRFLLLILLLGQLGVVWAAQAPSIGSGPEQLLGFAQQLFETGEYYRAITEYHRFLFLYPEHPKTAYAHFQIGACYFGGQQWEDAIKTWRANLDKPLPAKWRQQTLYQIAASFYQLGRYARCRQYLEQLEQEYPQTPLRLASQKLLAASYLRQERWADAAQVARQMDLANARQLGDQIAQGTQLPLKSPRRAAGLSAVLPGAGQLYAERPQDALAAFLLNGVFIWATLEAFSRDNEVAGGILLFFEAGWYFGNIYSAINSTHKYNRKITRNFREQTQERLQFKLGVPQVGPLGLSLSYRF